MHGISSKSNKVTPQYSRNTFNSNQHHHTTPHTGKTFNTPHHNYVCKRCGLSNHKYENCRHKNTVCNFCKITGHLEKACFKKQNSLRQKHYKHDQHQRSKIKSVDVNQSEVNARTEPEVSKIFVKEYESINTVSSTTPPIIVRVKCDGNMIDFELDTGASHTIISETLFEKYWSKDILQSDENLLLSSYTGNKITVLGKFYTSALYLPKSSSCESETFHLPVIVIKGGGKPLLGRNWLSKMKLNWNEIHALNSEETLTDLLRKHSSIFEKGCGTLKGIQVTLPLDSNVTPKFCKARSLPYAMQDKVSHEIDRLLEEGILEPVQFSTWAAPCVPVLKPDSTVRLCGDYSMTANLALSHDHYPLPRIEDLFAKLAGGKVFSKIDLSQAYQQCVIDASSRDCTTINTHRGLFRYTRLPYGINQCPSIFQRLMENLFRDCPNTFVYLDDILITGRSVDEHLRNLERALHILAESGLRVKKEKCEFLMQSITYLGHQIDEKGIHPTEEKVTAIKHAPTPTNVQELRAYCGIIQYYHKFCPMLSATLAPLFELMNKDVPWKWTDKQQNAFQKSKDLLTSNSVLAHYDPALPLIIKSDASPFGIGSVLSHEMPDGSVRPIAYASRSLHSAEKNYAQVEREALACIFGVTRFHKYIYGRKFILSTDHKPLLGLLQSWKNIPQQASPRMIRWALILAAYDYKLVFKPGTCNGNADALSRLPLPLEANAKPPRAQEYDVCSIALESALVTAEMIRQDIEKDKEMSQVKRYVQYGWPENINEAIRPFHRRKLELSLDQGCVFWGSRIVIPTCRRDALLKELHEGHPGICRMKALARSYVWWPNIDSEIENFVQHCQPCQETRPSPTKSKLHPWEWASTPWSRIHIDYKGPVDGKMYLVIICAHSKWIEILPTVSTSSATTIKLLKSVFVQHGLPHTVISDNGTCFSSAEFKAFCQDLGIIHKFSAPYHASSNGQAERAVQNLKHAMDKGKIENMSTENIVYKFLFCYRITPHTSTGRTPAELMYGRKLRCKLDLLFPDSSAKVDASQKRDINTKRCSNVREFKIDDLVFFETFTPGQRWGKGTVIERTGPLSYKIQTTDKIIRRHVDNMRKCYIDSSVGLPHATPALPSAHESMNDTVDFSLPLSVPQFSYESSATTNPTPRTSTEDRPTATANFNDSGMTASQSQGRYPTRTRHTPRWFVAKGGGMSYTC